MRKLFFSIIAVALCFGQSLAADSGSVNTRGGIPTQPSVEAEDLLYETFANVTGDGVSTSVDPSKFDNPGDWTFTDAFAADGCILIRKGGSVTTPSIPSLSGNASIYFSTRPYEDPETPIDYDSLRPHSLSVENGELNQSTFDEMVSMESIYIYGAGPETRVTLTADHDIILSSIKLSYGAVGANFYDRYTEVSVPEGEYYNPFEVTLTPYMGQGAFNDDGSHNITVYTLDGTTPTRASSRYDGTPIKIDRTTTLLTGTIFGNGGLCVDKPVVYTFPQSTLPDIPANTFTVNVTKPGSLKSLLLDIDADEINGLVLSGKINSEDLAYLSAAQGRVSNIQYLDLADLTFDYDGGLYFTSVAAPEGGMGTVTTYYYYLSEENRDERLPGGPMNENFACYRNDLSLAFCMPKLRRVVTPKCLTSIGEGAFSTVAMATLPDNVIAIGSGAFLNCQHIELPATIKRIGSNAFGPNLIMNTIELPAIEYIGQGAFAGSKVSSFILGDKLSYLGDAAFYGTKIAAAVMKMPTDTIPASLFAECSELRKVEITGDVKVIGEKAFANCKNIESFSIPETIEIVGIEAIPDYLLDDPVDGIIYVGRSAYKRVEDMASATLREGTVSITDALFSASPLSEITLPASLKYIGDAAFSGAQLKSTPEMRGVVSIGDYAFAYNTTMTRATLPESLEYLGDCVFYGNTSLWKLEYNCVDLRFDWNCTSTPVEAIAIGPNVRRIPRGLFISDKNITEIQLPASVDIIDDEAFEGCSNLVSVTSDGSIKNLGHDVFNSCRSLKIIPLLDMDSIPRGTFNGCENLMSVRLSDNIKKIGNRAFSDCTSLSDFYWPLNLEEVEYGAFGSCTSLETISLPEGVKRVDYYAFRNCKVLKNIYIPSSLTDFDAGAFSFMNEQMGATVTCMLPEPPSIKDAYWGFNNRMTYAKVPAASIDAYKAHPEWAFFGDNIVSVEGISAAEKTVVTSFGDGINEDSDLSDTVIGNVYVTLGEEDGYDQSDGALVINSTMEEEYAEAIGGMAPGASDLHNRFNGLVVMVPSGHGSIVVNCQTIGSRLVTVKFGEDAPSFYTKDSKGDITIDYDVDTDTYVYIYASEASADSQMTTRISDGDCIRIYSIGVTPEDTAVDSIADSISPIVEYYTLDGIRVANPSEKGVYIARRSDGSTSKVYLR